MKMEGDESVILFVALSCCYGEGSCGEIAQTYITISTHQYKKEKTQ
jgi:hypothetical protein